MTKQELKFLEKVFEKEINGRLYQSTSKIAQKLESEGFIEKITEVTQTALGELKVEGYVLTIHGNFAYCTSDLCNGDGIFMDGEEV